MKKMKKLLAMLLAAVMVMGMSVTVFAGSTDPDVQEPSAPETPGVSETVTNTTVEITDYPKESDRVNVTIAGVSGQPNVALYQIASAEYGNNGQNGLIRYNWVSGSEIDFANATSGQITEIANAIVRGEMTATPITGGTLSSEGVFTAKVSAGAYIAIITGAEDGSVYNPILLTATYNSVKDDQGNITGTELIGGSILASDAHYLNGASAVAKKTTPSIDKQINQDTIDKDDTISGNTLPEGTNTSTTPPATNNATASVGDRVEYSITPVLPSYPKEAVNKSLAISDRTSQGLTFEFSTLTLKLDGNLEVTKSEPDENGIVTFTYENKAVAYAKEVMENGKTVGFNMTFVYDALIYGENGAVRVPTITYKAVINDAAVVGSAGNTNTTTLHYTNQPNTDFNYDPTEAELPQGDDIQEKTDKETVYTYQLAFLKTGEGEDKDGLAGAVFGIYSDPSCTADKLIDIVTTNEAGYAVSSQVGAGTYYIKEISAPAGYSLNEDVFEIVAQWTTATTTITGTVTRREYTTNPDEAVKAEQIGWLDVKNNFYPLDAEVSEGENGVVSAETGRNLVAAYLKTETTTTNEETFISSNPGAGTVTSLKNLTTKDEGTTIPNTKLASLPSTGGIGTTLFTVGGCAIMIIAAGLFFATRRKAEK
ncbi:MAG: LPXTG cell wall anchor domain-containing protein [Lachnospiraceae bacterium]|nr:LPXTG cell wall anchor domain-containing protein [Lachnospiraceae bacterium]